MDYKKFLSQYFSGERASEIERNITPEKYSQLFNTLSPRQLEIINDDNSKYIVVSVEPGNGKIRVLVHKLASFNKLIPVLQFSSKCNDKVKNLIASGYEPYDAVVRFICAWKGKEDENESAVILADIYFHRVN